MSGPLRIHYLDWGNAQKPVFLLLHGIGRTAHSFDHIAPRFQANYHIIAMDRRGNGDSAWLPEGAYLVEDDVKDVEALADQLKLRDASSAELHLQSFTRAPCSESGKAARRISPPWQSRFREWRAVQLRFEADPQRLPSALYRT